MSIIRIETQNGIVDFSPEDSFIYYHDNPMYDHIRQFNGITKNGMEKTTSYPLWSLGGGVLRLADVLIENGFTSIYLNEPEEQVLELPIMHFHQEVEFIEQVVEDREK